jgi:hypothetical protein
MSGKRLESTSTGGKGGMDGFFAEAFWLAGKEMRKTWLSYPLTGLFALMLGFLVVPSASGVFEFEGFGAEGRRMEYLYNAFFADYLFLIICAFLGVRAIYAPFWRDSFYSRLTLLRSLPISAESLVASRALCMLFAFVINVPAFFGPAFFLSDLGASYLPFACVWIGYCLLASGLWLLLELTVSREVYTRIYFGLAAALIAVLALLEWKIDLRLVGRMAELAQSYGAVLAVFSVLAGAAAFAFMSRMSIRCLETRDRSV